MYQSLFPESDSKHGTVRGADGAPQVPGAPGWLPLRRSHRDLGGRCVLARPVPRDPHAYADAYSNVHTDPYSDSDIYPDVYGDPNGNCYRNAAVYPDPATAPYASTAPVKFCRSSQSSAKRFGTSARRRKQPDTRSTGAGHTMLRFAFAMRLAT